MKLGFEKSKVTCFKCKQKGHFKRECSNRQADDSVNPFHDDYYKRSLYHRNNEQPSRTNQKPIEEGSSKEKKQAMVTTQDDNKWGIQDDEGFNWNKYIKEDGELKALVAEFKQSREEKHARAYLSNVYDAFKEARQANRWSQEKECFVDPK
ncbi:putative transcription factor interactor and regulator CCHC(Zn) family [Helianthus anomalus]